MTLGHLFIAIPVHLRFRFLVAWPRPEDLVLGAKHLFVAAMMAWVHPRAHRKSANQNMTAVPRSLANRRFSRPSPRAGLLLCAKHLFAGAMVAGAHPGLPPIGKSEDRGAIRIQSREVFRGKSKASPLTRGCAAVHWQIDLLSPQDLLLCAKHLFVAAMVAWVRVSGNSEHDGRAVRVRSREMFRAAKQSAAVITLG